MIALAVLTLAAPAMAQAPIAPNGVAYTGGVDTLSAGTTYNLTFQLQYNGGQLKSEGVRVYLQANNTDIIPAEMGTYVMTDANGNASYKFTANKTGIVKLTIAAMSPNSGVTSNVVFKVTEGTAATPTAPATTPSPSAATPSATALPSITATPAPTVAPTTAPTAAPTVASTTVPTVPPTATPAESTSQAVGILLTGIIVAILLLAGVIISRIMTKK